MSPGRKDCGRRRSNFRYCVLSTRVQVTVSYTLYNSVPFANRAYDRDRCFYRDGQEEPESSDNFSKTLDL